MQQDAKLKTLAAIKRLEGLTVKLHTMVEEDEYCAKVLEIALAMQGQLKHIQGTVLESHLHTCAEKKLASKDKDAFIIELLKIIGLSTR
jgi:DNA-binding FrmR family transcriptional regulator